MEALNKLPYLDWVVRETLRLYAPVAAMVRAAAKDDVIPTESEWMDKKGTRHSGIPYVFRLVAHEENSQSAKGSLLVIQYSSLSLL